MFTRSASIEGLYEDPDGAAATEAHRKGLVVGVAEGAQPGLPGREDFRAPR